MKEKRIEKTWRLDSVGGFFEVSLDSPPIWKISMNKS